MAALAHLRARAITAYFAECVGIDNGIRKIVHAFCNSPPVAQVAAHRMGRAFAVLTEWNSVVTWGFALGGCGYRRFAPKRTQS